MAYSERKQRVSGSDWAKLNSKWAAQRPNAVEEAAKIPQQRRDLWQALNQFVTERGGTIVSPMFVSPISIEVAPDSELPARLRELGYDPVFCEQATRIGGVASPEYDARWRRGALSGGYAFSMRDVYLLRLPK